MEKILTFALILYTSFIVKAHILDLLNSIRINNTNIEYEQWINNQVATWNFGSFIRPENKSVEFDLKFFSPIQPGNYPVIIFLPGLDGIAGGFMYSDLLTKLAIDANSIIICFDKLSFPKFPEIEEKAFEKTLDWTLKNILALFNGKKTPSQIRGKVFPDINKYGVSLMGHSASGHPTVSYLNNTCGLIRSLILLDPVDGFDPFGFVKIFITNPPKQLPFVIPTLIIETGFDNVPKSQKFPACAPANLSNTRFYDSLPGPTWFLNFTNYGHADILDDWANKYVGSLICTPCQKNCQYDLYRTNVARAISFFLNGVNQKNSTYINAIENPKESSLFDKQIEILSVHKYNGYDVLSTGSFCIRKFNINFFNYF